MERDDLAAVGIRGHRDIGGIELRVRRCTYEARRNRLGLRAVLIAHDFERTVVDDQGAEASGNAVIRNEGDVDRAVVDETQAVLQRDLQAVVIGRPFGQQRNDPVTDDLADRHIFIACVGRIGCRGIGQAAHTRHDHFLCDRHGQRGVHPVVVERAAIEQAVDARALAHRIGSATHRAIQAGPFDTRRIVERRFARGRSEHGTGYPYRDAAAGGDVDVGVAGSGQLAVYQVKIRAAVVGRTALIGHAEQRQIAEFAGKRIEEADVVGVEVGPRRSVADGDVVFDRIALIDAKPRCRGSGLRDQQGRLADYHGRCCTAFTYSARDGGSTVGRVAVGVAEDELGVVWQRDARLVAGYIACDQLHTNHEAVIADVVVRGGTRD